MYSLVPTKMQESHRKFHADMYVATPLDETVCGLSTKLNPTQPSRGDGAKRGSIEKCVIKLDFRNILNLLKWLKTGLDHPSGSMEQSPGISF